MRASASLALAVAACAAGTVSGRGEFDGEAALAYVAEQVAFGPRIPNTEGHRRAGDWIEGQLRARADSVEVQVFTHVTTSGDTLRLRNFIGRFRPEVRERILLVAHWDTRPISDQARAAADRTRPVPGANDGGSGVAVLLGVADALKRRPPVVGVDLLFVDGEDYGDFGAGKDVLLGSRHYAQNAGAARPLFAVVFDMVGDQDPQFYQEGYSAQRAPEVVERVWSKAAELGHARVFRATVGQAITDDHLPLLEAGFRAIDVIDLDYPHWHTPEDTLDKVSARSLEIVGEVAIALVR
ncbi:MAG TPA: M28 family peptidase [Gemmatimonadales bacterium]|nr:M28 family peptidase [Gemmatimonadales bacterium]